MIRKKRILPLIFFLFFLAACSANRNSELPTESAASAAEPAPPLQKKELQIRVESESLKTEDADLCGRFEELFQEMSSVEESSEDILYLPGVVYESMFRYEFHCEEKTLYAYYTDGQLSYQDKEVEGEDMLVIEIIQDRTEAPDASVTSLVLEKGADLWVKTDEFLKAAEALLSE